MFYSYLEQLYKRRLYTWTSSDGQHQNQTDYILCSQDGEALCSQQKQEQEQIVTQIYEPLLSNSDMVVFGGGAFGGNKVMNVVPS